MTKGKLTYRFADREEVVQAGDAFYLPPGHIPVQNEPGSEIVQFSPTTELLETQAVMRKNVQAMQTGRPGDLELLAERSFAASADRTRRLRIHALVRCLREPPVLAGPGTTGEAPRQHR